MKHSFFKQALAIVLLGLALRIPLLSGSLWLDEAAQALESARPLSEQFNIIADFQPPLLHLITFASLRISTAEAWLRLWGALIPGIISIIYTIKIGKKYFSPSVGLIAGFLLSISSFHVYFSQELRPYALPAAFAVLSWWFLLNAVQDKKPLKTYVLYGVSTWLGLFSSYLYPFLVLGQIFYVLFSEKKRFGYLVKTLAVVAIAYAPWLPTFFKQLTKGQQVQAALPGWSEVVSIPQLKALPLTIAKFVYGVLLLDASAFFLISGMILVTSFTFLGWNYYKKNKKVWQKKELLILISWFIIPLLTAWIISFIVPVVRPKRVLLIQPGFLLGLAYLILWGKNQKDLLLKKSAILGLSTLCIISTVSLFSYYTKPQLQRENWRDLHTQITTTYPNNSVVVFSFPEAFAPWRWYDSANYPSFSTGALTTDVIPDLPEKMKYLTEYDYILVFDHLRTLTDPHDTLLQVVKDFGYREVDQIDYPNIGFVRVYARSQAQLSESR